MLERSADVKFFKNGDTNEKSAYHIDRSRVDSRNLESSIKRCWNYDSSVFHFRSQRRHYDRFRQRDPKQWSRKHCRWSQQRRESFRQRLYQHIAERIDPDAKYRRRNIGRSPPPVIWIVDAWYLLSGSALNGKSCARTPLPFNLNSGSWDSTPKKFPALGFAPFANRRLHEEADRILHGEGGSDVKQVQRPVRSTLKRRGERAEGDPSPTFKDRMKSGSAQAHGAPRRFEICWESAVRPGTPLGSASALAGALPWRVRGGAHSSSMEKDRISERASGAVRGLRDRLTG
jgi:hypothetical protein